MRFRSDNGPQFDAGTFQVRLATLGCGLGKLEATLSSEQWTRGGGRRAVKELVAKIAPSGDLSSE